MTVEHLSPFTARPNLYLCRFDACSSSKSVCVFADLQEQTQRAVQLEHERRLADDEAARLEAERQAALLAKEELARQAQDQLKSQEQLVRTNTVP